MDIRKTSKGNVTVINIGGTVEFLFSYQTFVACRIDGKCYKDETRYSVTTSKHIGQWLNDRECQAIPADAWRTWVDAWEWKFESIVQDPGVFATK